MPNTLSHLPAYYSQYVDLVPEDDAVEAMANALAEAQSLLLGISDSEASHAYAEGKWTIKELLSHIMDTERIFCYRALCIARGEQGELPGYDHDSYVQNSAANTRNISELMDELELVRRNSLSLFHSFTANMMERFGRANGQEIGVEAMAFIIAGHQRHHCNVIRAKYLNRN